MPLVAFDTHSQKKHKKGSMLDYIQHHSWQQRSNSGHICNCQRRYILCIHSTSRCKALFCCFYPYYDVLVQAVIDANIIPPLVSLLASAEFDIKKEAAWAISNATSGGTNEQIKYFKSKAYNYFLNFLVKLLIINSNTIVCRYLISQGCIKPLSDLLACSDTRIINVALEGLENILRVGEAEKDLGNTGGVNLYARYVDEAGGLEKVENLQTHDNSDIYEKSVKILETYWQEEDSEEQNMQSSMEPSPFVFTGSTAAPVGGFSF